MTDEVGNNKVSAKKGGREKCRKGGIVGGGGKCGATAKSKGVATTSDSGKEVESDKNGESRDDSFGLDNVNVMVTVAKMQKEMSAKPASITVSYRFTNVALQEGVYMKTLYTKFAIQMQLIPV